MGNLQGFSIDDAIWFESLKTWRKVGEYWKFDWATKNFAFDNPKFEVIANDTGFWTKAYNSINELDK